MSRPSRWWDVRVGGPAVVALFAFAWRALPGPQAETAEPARSVALPRIYGARASKRPQRFSLAAEASTARLAVDSGSSRARVSAVPSLAGELAFEPAKGEGALTLRFDLSSMQPAARVADETPRELVFRGRLVANNTTDLAGVGTLTWLGTWALDESVVQQRLTTWQCRLPARPLRWQTVVKLPARELGVDDVLSVATDRLELGIDLAWRRARASTKPR